MRAAWGWLAALAAGLTLVSCTSPSTQQPPPPPPTYSIGGTVSGLQGSGLVLHSSLGEDLSVSTSGSFTFLVKAVAGVPYEVTVKTQPSSPTQVCTVAGGSGTIATANVTSVAVTCTTSSFTVGGTVTGLQGTGLVLQLNGNSNLAVSPPASPGGVPFTFSTPVPSGQIFAVTVLTQPSSPTQSCTVANGRGTVGGADVTNVTVACSSNTYAIGGTVTGLQGSGLVLSSNLGEDLPITGTGVVPFTFATKGASGSPYAITVRTQPASPAQTCSVVNGTGTLANADVNNVIVNCSAATFTVGGTVNGLTGSGLVLQLNGAHNLPVAAAGPFSFASAPIASGTPYTVAVLTQPASPSQTCTVTANGTGTVGSAPVTSVVVTCVTNTYAVGGTVTGLAGSGLVLQLNGAGNLPVASGATSFAFPPVASGAVYAVTVLTQPASPTQTCTVANGTGTVGGAPVSSVAITCTTNAFAVGGTVSGLGGSGLVLQLNGAGNLPVAASGPFSFATPIASGAAYTVSVLTQPTGPSQTCTVTANATGNVGSAAVTNVAVTCVTNTYAVGGTVTGLAGSGLVLRLNGANDLPVAGTGSVPFSFASAPVASGATYTVSVLTQPTNPIQTCNVTAHATGTVGGAAVTDVAVTCTTNGYTVGGTVSGLTASGLVLRLNGANDLTVSSGATGFTFAQPVAIGAAYAVTVATQPAGLACSVANGSGTIVAANVTNVAVTCVTTFTVGGTVTGLEGTGLVLRNNGGNDLAVTGTGTVPFTFTQTVNTGAAYAVTVATQPTGPAQNCTVTNGAGTMGGAAVTSVAVACVTSPVIQRWVSPSTWGGTGGATPAFWPDDDPTLVEHLTFAANGDPIERAPGIAWNRVGTVPAPISYAGFANSSPPTARYGAGPFDAGRYQAVAGDGALNLRYDMLACAVIKPDWDPGPAPGSDGYEKVIFAKGRQSESGWVLMQMHRSFCFHYQGVTAGEGMGFTPTLFSRPADGQFDGPLNPGIIVVCGGRDILAGRIVVAANNTILSTTSQLPWAGTDLMDIVPDYPATIGGYDNGDPNHVFNGRVYEVAVWNLPATPENIQAKTAAVLGLHLPDGTAGRYVRYREAPYTGVDGAYHTAWQHGPRIHPTKGFLFGLQGANRVRESTSAYPEVIGEALGLWTATGTPTAPDLSPNVRRPPGDNLANAADRLTLWPGTSFNTQLDNFPFAGPIQGQIWLWRETANTGTLRVRVEAATTPTPTDLGHVDIALGSLPAGQWNRVFLTGLETLGTPTQPPPPAPPIPDPPERIYLENPAASGAPLVVDVWGITLTHVGERPVDLTGLDPGPTMYDTLVLDSDEEYLELPPVASTAATGFCLAADAQPSENYSTTPPGNLPWDMPFETPRVSVGWTSPTALARVLVNFGGVCFRVDTASGVNTRIICSPIPAQWTNGSKHTMAGCITPAGDMRLYVDNGTTAPGTLVEVNNGSLGAPAPDLATGRVRVGSDGNTVFHGYVSRAVVCRPAPTGGIPAGCQ